MTPSIVAVLAIGGLLGFRHAFEPDHLAAVSTLASRPGARLWSAARLGLIWGLGHSVTVGVVVLVIIAFGVQVPERFWPAAELLVAALLILVVCLFRPMLLLSAAVAQRNYVGVLIDDSRSMQLTDEHGSRADLIRQTFGKPDSSIMKALSDRRGVAPHLPREGFVHNRHRRRLFSVLPGDIPPTQ